MALVTYVLGDCPKCGAKDSFGNVEVYKDYILRGCKRCRYLEHLDLPPCRKKILYLDQFFFSHTFRNGEKRFIDAAAHIARMASLQLLVVPFSSIHEDETHQWEKHDELMEFIKATARGEEFEPSYDVEHTQLVKAFKAWLIGGPQQYQLELSDALSDDIHGWDSYIRIDVGRYMGDIELIRNLKRQSVEGLIDLFDEWRELHTSFADDLQAEYQAAGQKYINSYLNYMMRLAHGDFNALLDAPIISQIMQTMLHAFPEEIPMEQRMHKCAEFFVSDHFKQTPYQQLSALMFATLKAMVKDGAYTNRERALQRLSGFFYDVAHIATYAPYVDGFIVDQPMAELVSKPTVSLEQIYGTKIFSLNNWDELFAWLDALEACMSDEHKAGLAAAYPRILFQ